MTFEQESRILTEKAARLTPEEAQSLLLDLYGQEARVEFLQFRRSEKKFGSVEELKNQMDEDIQAADNFFQPDNS